MDSTIQMFQVFARAVIRVFLALAMTALLVMMLAIVIDVFMRYAFNAPVVGVFDLVEICLAIAVFYSMGAAISLGHEIIIDLVDQFAPAGGIAFLSRSAALLSAVVLAFIFFSMLTPAIQSHQYGEMLLELNIPVWVVWVVSLVGMCGGLLASVMNILNPPKGNKNKSLTRSETS